jgi:H+/Cl- antiporter ClcA
VLFLEILGLARRQTMLVVLPCLLSSGVGALLFTGLGDWTGFEIGALAIPDLVPVRLDVADVVWALPVAAAMAVVTWVVFLGGRRTARLAASHAMATPVGAGLIAGAAACVYALLTGHSPAEVAMSGQATLPVLAADPAAWSTGALIALLTFKAIAYALCLGAFRGGAIFPAVMLGAAFGVLASTLIPHLAVLPAIAIGMAAGTAVIGFPVTSVVLVVLLLGNAAASLMPVVILAVVAAMVVQEMLSSWTAPATGAGPDH